MKRKKRSSIYHLLSEKTKAFSGVRESRESLDIAGTVLRLRQEKKLSGVELCRKAGDMDPRTLTAVEKGRIQNPSIKTLQSLSRGLEVPVSDLFRQAEMNLASFCSPVSKKGAYEIVLPQWGVKMISFTPFVKNFFCGKLILGARKKISEAMLKHSSPIFISTLIGRFEVWVEGKSFAMREGENLFFNGILKHTIYNPMQRESTLLMVTAPSFL